MTAMTAATEQAPATRDPIRDELTQLWEDWHNGLINDHAVDACLADIRADLRYYDGLAPWKRWEMWELFADACQRLACLALPGGCHCCEPPDGDGHHLALTEAATADLEHALTTLTGRTR